VSTGLIIAIVVVVLIVVAVLALLPRMRARAEERKVEQRRGEVAGAHREEANAREQRAAEAETVAKRERAQAEVHSSEADLHERGLADDRLDEEHGRIVGDGTDTERDRTL
jgi:type II secretory pathway pseudopilin PulG